MKKRVLSTIVVSPALAAIALWLSCQRSPSTAHPPAVETERLGASTVAEQTVSRISPQAELKPPSAPPPATIPDADQEDDKQWRKTPEFKAFEDEIERIPADAYPETHGAYLTSNQVAFVITYMQSPHYDARRQAVTFAAGSSDPDKSGVLPYVVSLLSDPVWKVRMCAADTLGDIGDKSMIPYLEPLLNDRLEVAQSASMAISKLQQKEAVPKDH